MMWERTAILKLIQLYNDQPVLYEIKNENYHNKAKRNEALLEIAHAMQEDRPRTTILDVKKKINIMRTQYLAERAKMKKSPESYEPVLWFYKELSFLEPHVTEKKRIPVNGLLHHEEEYETDCNAYVTQSEIISGEDQFVDARTNSSTSVVDDTLETMSSGSSQDMGMSSLEAEHVSVPVSVTPKNNFLPSSAKVSQIKLEKNMSTLHREKRRKQISPEQEFFSKFSSILSQVKKTASSDSESIWGNLMVSKLREIKNKKVNVMQ